MTTPRPTSAAAHDAPRRLPPSPRGRSSRGAFTLTEIMVVIGIIVLLLTLSLPAITYITGSRSTDSAQNVVAAALTTARNYALSEQKPCGVLFYVEPATQTVSMAIVHGTGATPAANYDIVLDRIPESNIISLPRGVRVQGIMSAPPVNTTTPDTVGTTYNPRTTDCYIGYNTVTRDTSGNPAYTITTAYGPVVMFDGSGKLTSLHYEIAGADLQNGNYTTSEMAYALYSGSNSSNPLDRSNPITPSATRTSFPDDVVPTTPGASLTSVVALAFYDEHAFKDQGLSDSDWVVDHPVSQAPHSGAYNDTTGADTNELAEEDWLDKNATPVLINRYNGTLFKSE